ncbi:MAG: glycosyltransferase, partial [archaeon]
MREKVKIKDKYSNRGKVLFIATVDSHIYYFHIPFMRLIENMGYKVEVATSNTGFKNRIENEGFTVHDIPFRRNPLNPKNIVAFFILLNLMKRRNYLMLHTHTPVASFVGRIAGKIAGIPHIVYTAHGFHFHEYGNPLTNFLYFTLEKFAGKFTDVLITINTDDYKIAKEKNFAPNGRVVYIKGVGVDTERFNPGIYNISTKDSVRESIGLSSQGFMLICIAELIKRKNIKDIILSLPRNYNMKFNLAIVGNGPLKER